MCIHLVNWIQIYVLTISVIWSQTIIAHLFLFVVREESILMVSSLVVYFFFSTFFFVLDDPEYKKCLNETTGLFVLAFVCDVVTFWFKVSKISLRTNWPFFWYFLLKCSLRANIDFLSSNDQCSTKKLQFQD